MTINLHFSHVEVPDYLRINIEGYITEMFGELAQKSNLAVSLFCKKEIAASHKTNNEKFKCHIEASAPWLHKKVFVQSSGDECWETIMSASARMKRQIFSHKKSDHRKRGRTDWNLAAYSEEVAV